MGRRIAFWAVVCSAAAHPVLASSGESTSHLGIPDAIWLPINLGVFLFLLYRFVGKPMGAFLDTRREGIAAELKQAEQKLVDAEALRELVLNRLAEVEKDVEEIKERAESHGAAEAERIAEQTIVEEERFLKRIDEEISRRQVETRHQLAEETATLTAQLARDLLAKEMTEADRQRILDRSLKAMQDLQD